MTETTRILIADDEPSNVESFIEFLVRSGIEYDYAGEMDLAAEMVEEAQLQGRPYSVVVCDNHFNQVLPEYGSSFDGVDLVNILVGNEYNFTAEHDEFIDAHFKNYEAIRDTYEGRVIMFSGSAVGDSKANPTLYRGLTIVNKHQTEYGSCSEEELVHILQREFGIKFSESIDTLRQYREEHGLESGVGSESTLSHEERVEAFLAGIGIEEDRTGYLLGSPAGLDYASGFDTAIGPYDGEY